MSLTGPIWFQASLLPGRAGYLIQAGSVGGFRRAMQEATSRWGGQTEPIVPVHRNGTVDSGWAQMVANLSINGLVNVDLDDEVANAAARSLKLPVTPLKAIDKMGPQRWTVHPMSFGGNRIDPPLIAPEKPRLWQVAAVGDLTETSMKDLLESNHQVRRANSEGEVAWAASTGSSLIHHSAHGLTESFAEGGMSGPAIIWFTNLNTMQDCLWFWNLRALRPLGLGTPPVLLLPNTGWASWAGFPKLLSTLFIRPAEFTPDVLLVSFSVPDEALAKFADIVGLERSQDKLRYGHRWPAEMRKAPFTYRLNQDPRSYLVFHREYTGGTASVQGHVASGQVRLRLPNPSPVFGSSLLRISSDQLGSFPKRASVAHLFHSNAEWYNKELQFGVMIGAEIDLSLTVPSMADCFNVIVRESVGEWKLSDKGRMGEALLARLNLDSLNVAGLGRTISLLATPRSKELERELRSRQALGLPTDELLEIAMVWGGRGERKYVAGKDLPRAVKSSGAPETLCDLGWAERGMEVRCRLCGLSSFIPLHQAERRGTCLGCDTPGSYTTSGGVLTTFYRLNSLVDRASDQGVIWHLLAMASLNRNSGHDFLLPGVLLDPGSAIEAEADLLGLFDGRLLSGEAKANPAQFTRDQIQKDIAVATTVGAEIYLMVAGGEINSLVRELAQEAAASAGLELVILDNKKLKGY